MAITLAPQRDVTPIAQAGVVAGRGDADRFKQQQDLRTRQVDLQAAELAQREKLTYADMAFKEAMQSQNFDEAAKARQFGLDAQKELTAIQHAENQKAREFDFGARRYLQDDQQQFGVQQQTQQLAFQEHQNAQRIAAGQWEAIFNATQRERQLAAQIIAQQQRDVFNAQNDFAKMGYGAHLNNQSAEAAQQRQMELMPYQTTQALAQYGGQLDLRQQQEQARIAQQIEIINQAERSGQITPQTADQMRTQVQLQGSGVTMPSQPGNFLPIVDPTTNEPLRDPATGLPLLRDPVTGAPVKLPAGAPPVPKPPADSNKLIKDIADSIIRSAPDGTVSYAEAWDQAQRIINGQSGAGGGGGTSPLDTFQGLDAPAPLNFNNPSGGLGGGLNGSGGFGATAPAQPVPSNPAQLVSGQTYGPVNVNGEMWYVRWNGQAFEGVQKVQ